MSAYLVNHETINCLVNAYFTYVPDAENKWTEFLLGTCLFDENIRSLIHCYNDPSSMYSDVTYEYTKKDYTFAEIVGCIANWRYQAMETPDFDDTVAAKAAYELSYHLLISRLNSAEEENYYPKSLLEELKKDTLKAYKKLRDYAEDKVIDMPWGL